MNPDELKPGDRVLISWPSRTVQYRGSFLEIIDRPCSADTTWYHFKVEELFSKRLVLTQSEVGRLVKPA